MAIGKVGSFATVDTAGFDVASMMRGAQQEQSRLNRQQLAMEEAILKDKNDILASLKSPEVDSTGEYNVDTFLHKGVDLMKEKQYEYYQKMNNGEISRAEMQGLASTFNRELDNFVNDVNFLTEGAKNFLAKAEAGELSDGMSDNSVLVFDKILSGKIDDVKIKDNGRIVAMIGDQEIDIHNFRNVLENPPQNSNFEGIVKDFADQMKSRLEKTVTRGDYGSLETKGMTPEQEKEVLEYGKAMAYDQKFLNDLWYKVEGQKDKLFFGEDDDPDAFAERVGQKMLESVKNRMVEERKEEFKVGARDSERERQRKADKEEQSPIIGIETSKTLSDIYEGNTQMYNEINQKYKLTEDDNFVVLNEGAVSINFTELKQADGLSTNLVGLEDSEISNMDIDSFTFNKDGDMVVNGSVEIELPSVSKTDRVTSEQGVKIGEKDGEDITGQKSTSKTLSEGKEKRREKVVGIISDKTKIKQILSKSKTTKEEVDEMLGRNKQQEEVDYSKL